MANNDTTVIGCTRCHIRAASASGLCAECVESLQDENRRLRAFVEEVVAFAQASDVFRVKGELLISGDRLAEQARALLTSMQAVGTVASAGEASVDEWALLSDTERYALDVAYKQSINSATMGSKFDSVLGRLDHKGYLRPLPHVESGLLTDYVLTDKGKWLVQKARFGITPKD